MPNKIGHSKKGPEYRYLATREELKQSELPGMEKSDNEYLFPVMRIKEQQYKVFGIVTNMDWKGEELIPWLYQRCGKSEEAHAAMKNDFAGGQFPSGDFGENAAWWRIMVFACNLNSLMKRLALGESWVNKRMKPEGALSSDSFWAYKYIGAGHRAFAELMGKNIRESPIKQFVG